MQESLKGQSDVTPITAIQWDSSWPESASRDDRLALLSYLETRFGLKPGLFQDYLFFRKRKSWWIFRKTPLLADVSRIKISRMGMKAFQQVGRFIKPTTRFIQAFGRHATKATLVVEETQLRDLMEGKGLDISLEIDPGYVILSMDEPRVVGLGLYVNGLIRSQISKKALKAEMIQKMGG
jgi:NOL1/NOP2/fmu family ribosome biogenesis protein